MKKVYLLQPKTKDRVERMLNQHENLKINGGTRTLSKENAIIDIDISDEDETATGALVVYRVSSTSVKVTWGVVEGTIPSNINSTIAAGSNSAIWMDITMQEAAPWGVVSATIMASSSGFPDINQLPYIPHPVTGKPAEKLMFPLAVSDDGEIQNTNGSIGGSIGIYRNAISHHCQTAQPATPGDPNADPPIPPQPAVEGGIVETLEWVTYRI